MKLSCLELWCAQFVCRLTVPFCQGFGGPSVDQGLGREYIGIGPRALGMKKFGNHPTGPAKLVSTTKLLVVSVWFP